MKASVFDPHLELCRHLQMLEFFVPQVVHSYLPSFEWLQRSVIAEVGRGQRQVIAWLHLRFDQFFL